MFILLLCCVYDDPTPSMGGDFNKPNICPFFFYEYKPKHYRNLTD